MNADAARGDLAALDDGELVARTIAGRQAAFREIMRRHRDPLYRVVRGHVGDAEEALDLVQDCFATAWRHLAGFDQSRPLRPWLARIAINRARDWHRRRALRRFIGFGVGGEEETVPADEPLPDAAAGARIELERAWAAIARLPERLRETLLLRTVNGLSQAETAAALKISEKAVETRLYRARLRLTALLGEG
ncbi:RNA polymerase sigma factor [Sphingomonas sp. H39-1-10]|uniref:RNA polymerase sigma factor n=1 Tax=Sphingomonas pollutisoli TaxID=3030829 RepID=UPI0023B9D706|nr:RNA polymerase sigma factor [Sphingomonas pollutisoli]MDF0488437.1 RNA polymerase sigma factor [Sphingomonas pollutisoli]